MANVVVLIGRLTRDPELRYIQGSGNAVSKFGLAVDKNLSKDKKQEMESQGKHTADFVNIVTWGKIAENCAKYLKKGRLVGVQGRIQSGSYVNDEGRTIYTTDVVAQNVEFLEWGDNKDESSSESVTSGFQDINDNDNIPF